MRTATTRAAHALVLLAALAVALAACGSSAAARPCWKQVQDDWVNNRLGTRTYPASCYDEAIRKLPPDLKYYSDAPDAILNAKQRQVRNNDRHLQGLGSGGTSTPGGPTGDGGSGTSSSPVSSVLNAGTNSTDGIPLPLLIVGALALLLLAAGAVGVANRHIQARRATTDKPAA